MSEHAVPYRRAVYYLATRAPISREELRVFILEQGGEPHSEVADGYFSDPMNWHALLAIEWATEAKAQYLRRADRFIDTKRGGRASQEARDALARITQALGGPPHDFVELHLTSGQESQEVATTFVQAFAERWGPSVLESSFTMDIAEGAKKVWTMDEVLELARTKRRLPTLRGDIENVFEVFLEKYRAEQAEEGERPSQ